MSTLLGPENIEILTSLFVAMFLGMIIGTERIYAHKTAGMRTYALVSMGSALFVIISKLMTTVYAGVGSIDPLHMPSQIIAGVGFLGAGLIVFKNSKVKGLTTASSLWVSAGIGMAAGFGEYALAFMATVLTLFIFIVMWFIEQQVKKIPGYLNEEDEKDGEN